MPKSIILSFLNDDNCAGKVAASGKPITLLPPSNVFNVSKAEKSNTAILFTLSCTVILPTGLSNATGAAVATVKEKDKNNAESNLFIANSLFNKKTKK